MHYICYTVHTYHVYKLLLYVLSRHSTSNLPPFSVSIADCDIKYCTYCNSLLRAVLTLVLSVRKPSYLRCVFPPFLPCLCDDCIELYSRLCFCPFGRCFLFLYLLAAVCFLFFVFTYGSLFSVFVFTYGSLFSFLNKFKVAC